MVSGRSGRHSPIDVWPVIADAFLALLAVVVVMASGKQPRSKAVEVFKQQIAEKARGEFSSLLANVDMGQNWIRLIFSDETLSFETCQWDLTQEKQRDIQKLFRWLGERAEIVRQIRIEGHADRRRVRECPDLGPFKDNLQLSQNRARAVYNVLLGFSAEERDGLQTLLDGEDGTVPLTEGLGYLREMARSGELEVSGYGDTRPRDKSNLDSPVNRRVEVVLELREPPTSDRATSQAFDRSRTATPQLDGESGEARAAAPGPR